MGKYTKLWEYLVQSNRDNLKLTFEEVEKISGSELNHSFLKCKKELLDYGYELKKISTKNKDIIFVKRSIN